MSKQFVCGQFTALIILLGFEPTTDRSSAEPTTPAGSITSSVVTKWFNAEGQDIQFHLELSNMSFISAHQYQQ